MAADNPPMHRVGSRMRGGGETMRHRTLVQIGCLVLIAVVAGAAFAAMGDRTARSDAPHQAAGAPSVAPLPRPATPSQAATIPSDEASTGGDPVIADHADGGGSPSSSVTPKTRNGRPAPLRATIRPSSDTGVATIVGGTPPFTVTLVADDGRKNVVYQGSDRTVSVPLMPGPTRISIIDAGGSVIVAAALGNVDFWVVDNTARKAIKYNTQLATITVTTAVPGDGTPANVDLRNIAVRSTDGCAFVVVADSVEGLSRNRLIKISSLGAVEQTITVPDSYKLQDVTFDASGNIYTIDRGTGYWGARLVRIAKFRSTNGNFMSSALIPLPANGFGYPQVNLTNMIEYRVSSGRLVARTNTGTFAIINPSNLAVESYRYSADYAYTCMALDDTALYTGGAGFNRPAFFGRQANFFTDTKYAQASIINTSTPVHSWITTPTLPAIADVSVDSSHYVYTVQRDDANRIFRIYVVDPMGLPVTDIGLPYAQKLSVVR